MKKTIAFYLQSGVEVLDFAGPMEVFAYAGYEVFTVSKTKDPIVSQGILKIIPDYDINDAPQADILAFFGGNSGAASDDPDVINWVKSQQHLDYHFSVCTGALVLAKAGILENKTATTFHDALDYLEQNYPKTKVLRNARYVDNGTIITTAGISAGIDGALHLVARLNGFNAARKVAYYMEYDKWFPGEGVMLSGENPYAIIENVDHLIDYVGVYEIVGGQKIELKISEREKSLYAIINEMKYPLFYNKKDLFEDVSKNEVVFKRDKNNKIIGCESSGDSNYYKKLN
ncbi:MAG: hypothetical protein COA50_13605 [Flavobacteriaceae bacterium]|nr:MAG: hypothetical protein COA50_13605 [Flavobacteriaceae bacterium]